MGRLSINRPDIGMKITDTDHGFDHMTDQFESAKGKKLLVGWFERSLVEGMDTTVLRVAILNEFGMWRKNIPENAPLRMMFDEKSNEIADMIGIEGYRKMLAGETIDMVLENLGPKILDILKSKMSFPKELMRTLFRDSSQDERETVFRQFQDAAEFKIEKG